MKREKVAPNGDANRDKDGNGNNMERPLRTTATSTILKRSKAPENHQQRQQQQERKVRPGQIALRDAEQRRHQQHLRREQPRRKQHHMVRLRRPRNACEEGVHHLGCKGASIGVVAGIAPAKHHEVRHRLLLARADVGMVVGVT